MSDKLIEEALSIMGDRTCEEIITDVCSPYSHLLQEPLSREATASTGTLSFDTLSRVLDDMYANARDNSHMMLISVETTRRIRHFYYLGQMYRALPVPRRKIRKCHMRKLQQRWRAGREHIRRVESAERAREEATMRRYGITGG